MKGCDLQPFSRSGRGTGRTGFYVFAAVLLALVESSYAGTVGTSVETQAVFHRYAESLVRIRVTEIASGAKAVTGSGFFVTRGGHIVTNYHVIAKLVHRPNHYRAEYMKRDGKLVPLQIRAIDVVHDVAVVQSKEVQEPLVTSPIQIRKGTRLYALGYPYELGLSIVEGTYNGHLDHTLYKKIHFTGSLNPGMSGGPTITADGKVVGINVSTAGNQVSFLVPITRATDLLDKISRSGYNVPNNFLDIVRQQLLAHQDDYFGTMLEKPMPTVAFGRFRLPGKIAPFFNCWGDARREESKLRELVTHECSTDDQIYISSDHRSGVIRYRHHVLTTKELNRFQFFTLYSEHFSAHYGPFRGSKEEMTRFLCKIDSVIHGNTTLKVAFCVRAYRKLAGLYDAVMKVAVLGAPFTGVESSFAISGVSFDNARRLARRYLEAISWTD